MTDQFSDLILIAAVTIVITVLWAASVAYTYWDSHRQGLPAGKTLIWLLLVTLLPFIGFIAYIVFKLIAGLQSRTTNDTPPVNRRETPLKRPLIRQSPTSTVLASDVKKQPAPQPSPPIQTQANLRQGAGKYILTISYGPDLGKEFVIESLPAKIGRGPAVMIGLDRDLGVSREHAELYEQAGSLRLRDLNSTHGTQVNGVTIEDESLSSGDRIQVGLTVLSVTIVKG